MNTTNTLTLSTTELEVLPKSSLRNLPVNLFASVMGLSGLSLAWRQAYHYVGGTLLPAEAIGAFAVLIFAMLTLAYGIKCVRYPALCRAEFNHPVTGNFFGTITISMMLVSAVVGSHFPLAGEILWSAGSLLTLLLSALLVSRLFKGDQDPQHALPVWLIPGVASLDIAVTGSHMPMAWASELNLAGLAIGGLLALVFIIMIFQRLIQQAPLATGMTPSMMILVAPFAVGFLAYTNYLGTIDRFAGVLYYFALFLFAVVSFKVFHTKMRFAISWWAISFPMAALSNAALKYGYAQEGLPLQLIAIAILLFLSLALAVLTVKTLSSLLKGQLLAG